MPPACLINCLTASGFSLRLAGERLLVNPSGGLTDRMRALIRAHKPWLVDYLREAHHIWFVRHSDGQWYSHSLSTPATHDQMASEFPDALELEPEVDHEEPPPSLARLDELEKKETTEECHP